MGENTTSPNVPAKGDLHGGGQGGGPSGSASGKPSKVKDFAGRLIGKARKMNVWRFLVLLGGLAAIGGGLYIWLAPVGATSATENTTTTVIDGAGHKSTTVVIKNAASKSDTMLVALFTAGVGLLAVGALWDRIREVGFGNLSIKLTEAAVEQQEIPFAAAEVEQLNSLDSTAPKGIANEVRNLPKDLMLARIDLWDGTCWAPENLKFYVLMLTNPEHSSVKVLIFTGRLDGEPGHYFGAAPVAWLADKVELTDPALFAAYQMIKEDPIASKSDADQLGQNFWNFRDAEDKKRNKEAEVLKEPVPQPRNPNDRVDWGWLKGFAGDALITQSIEIDLGKSLSRQEQLEVLAFPLVFVPITNRRRFGAVLDKRRIAQTLGFSVVGF